MLLFILSREWVMVVSSLFSIHHVVVNMCFLGVRLAPRPFPGISSLVFCARVHLGHVCVFKPDCF